jgi:hypothetical protein
MIYRQLAVLVVATNLSFAFSQAPRPAAPAKPSTPAKPSAPVAAPPAEKVPPLKELSLDLKGTAYTGPGWEKRFPDLAKTEFAAELKQLNLKLDLSPVDMSTLYRSKPEFSVSDATAIIIEPFEMRVISRDYALVMGVDPEERCHREVQVVTLKASGIKRLEQLDGKNVAFLDGREAVVYLTKASGKYKGLLQASREEELKAALTAMRAQAFVAPVYRLPTTLVSEALGTQKIGKTDGEFEVIHVTDNKVPCWGIALKKGVSPEPLFRLMEYAKANPERGKRLLSSVGNFQGMYPLAYENWPALREHLGREIYTDFKSGKLKLPVPVKKL